MEKDFERLLQEAMDWDADRIMDKVNSDPNVRELIAPEVVYDKLMAQIEEHKAEQKARTEEEEELIRLGKKYKKVRKWKKPLIVLVAIVGAMGISVTCMGGPKKVIQKVEGMFDGKEQTLVDSDGERTEGIQAVSEVDAYEQIDEEFGFYPVRLNYVPEGMEFSEATIDKNLQTIQLVYEKDGKVLSYVIKPNYRTGSTSADVEDTFSKEYDVLVKEISVNVRQYSVEENETERWRATFEYQGAQYSLLLIGLEEEEVKTIIENLYFN